MSVVGATYIQIRPIFREPSDIGKRLYTHRWTGSIQLTGDGTGGSYTANIYFGITSSLRPFGQYAMWTLEYATMFGLGTLATPSGSIYIEGYERSSDDYVRLAYHLAISGASMCAYGEGYSGLAKGPFRFTENPSVPTFIIMNLQPNTNLVQAHFDCGGWIIDERNLP